MNAPKQYAERDIIEQGEAYVRHVNAMTAEGLHEKSDIAAELAHRDIRIAELEATLREVQTLVYWMNSGRTHYEGCSADHPLCELAGKVRAALRGSSHQTGPKL